MIIDFSFLLKNILASLQRVLLGGGLAFFVGIFFGVIRYQLPNLLKKNFLFNLILDAPKFPPPIAWIPLVILAFGIGEKASLVIVFIGVFPPVATSTYDSLHAIKSEILRSARSLEFGALKMLYRIYIPAILPQLFTGARVGLGMGWMSIIAAEMISGDSGLGYSIQLNRINLRYDLMIVDMICISLVGFFLHFSLTRLEKKVIRWNA